MTALDTLLKNDTSRNIFLKGLNGSGPAMTIASLFTKGRGSYVCVLNDQEEAGYFYHDLMQLTASNEVYFFPSAYRRAIKYGHVDPANEILVATPDAPSFGFARTIYNPAEVIDQNLSADPVTVTVKAADGGYDLTVTANAYARDVFCMVDKVDPQARIDGGLDTLLPGESLTWHVVCGAIADPSAFAEARVMRSANDLKR